MKSPTRKKSTTVREHPVRVPVSDKNPDGTTLRDRHVRRLKGTYLDPAEIRKIFGSYDRSKLKYPARRKLLEYPNSDTFDDLIAVWTDYFNKTLKVDPPLDPDVFKALLGSESDFRTDPKENRKIAVGIAQITKPTLRILQDPSGEAKEFTFKDVSQKDLKDPAISIPLAVRWLHRKNQTARSQLGRAPNHEELILEYKGLLKSKTEYEKSGLKKYRATYEKLKK